jgi:CheY-like chemotaxis protein
MDLNFEGNAVLVVDDDPFMRRLITAVLKKNNPRIQVAEAENGLVAYGLVKQSRPDVVIVDVVMPKMNGEELSKKLRELYPDLPILVLTGFDNPESKKRLMEEVKVNSYLNKAMDMNSFYGEVAKLFSFMSTKPKGL